jgi:acetyl esterase/lipase
MLSAFVPSEDRLARSEVELAGVTTFVLRPGDVSEDGMAEAPLFLELHGGALIMGKPEAPQSRSDSPCSRRLADSTMGS